MNNNSDRTWFPALAFIAIASMSGVGSPQPSPGTVVDDEQQVGQEVFNELKAKGEIISASPLYDSLTPIVTPIVQTAQPRYNHPFKGYLVHQAQANASPRPAATFT